MILKYARTAPLVGLTLQFRDKMKPDSSSESDLMGEVKALKEIVAKVNERLSESLAKECVWESRIAELTESNLPYKFVCNRASGVWHRVAGAEIHGPPELVWRTVCGWDFRLSVYSTAVSLPAGVSDKLICGKCLPDMKVQLGHADELSSD